MRVRNMVALALFLGLGARAEAAGTLVVCTEANPDALNAQLSTAQHRLRRDRADRGPAGRR